MQSALTVWPRTRRCIVECMIKRSYRFFGAALLAVLSLLMTPVAPAYAQSAPAAEIIRYVNEFRATLGLPPFRINAQLTAAAQQQASYMAASGIYSHTGAGGTSPYDRAVAAGYSGRVSENIVGGTSMTPRQGVIWWQNSPVHYNTITSSYYVEIGAGFAQGFDQNFYAIVVGAPGGITGPPPAAGPAPQPIIVTPIALAAPRADGSIVHTVGAGQALWTIAAYYEVELDFLLRINNLTADDFVQPGDEIVVRLADGAPTPTPLPTPTPAYEHTVSTGQTLFGIAQRYSVPLADLLLLNELSEQSVLRPGDILRVRLRPGEAPPPTPTPPLTHIVQSGQTLWTIAALHGLTLEQLLTFNGLSETAVIRPNDALWIVPPATAVPPTATPAPTATASATLPPPATVARSVAAVSPPPSPVALAAVPPTATALLPVAAPDVAAGDGRGILAGVVVVGALLLFGALVWINREN